MSWTHHFGIFPNDVSNCFLGEFGYETVENDKKKHYFFRGRMHKIS